MTRRPKNAKEIEVRLLLTYGKISSKRVENPEQLSKRAGKIF
jgi:hypothetical protein